MDGWKETANLQGAVYIFFEMLLKQERLISSYFRRILLF